MKKTILVFLTVATVALFGFACKQENNTNTTDTGVTDTSSTVTTTSSTDTSMTGTTGTMSTDTTGTGMTSTDTSMTGTMGTTDTSMTSTTGTTGTTATSTSGTSSTTTTKKHCRRGGQAVSVCPSLRQHGQAERPALHEGGRRRPPSPFSGGEVGLQAGEDAMGGQLRLARLAVVVDDVVGVAQALLAG